MTNQVVQYEYGKAWAEMMGIAPATEASVPGSFFWRKEARPYDKVNAVLPAYIFNSLPRSNFASKVAAITALGAVLMDIHDKVPTLPKKTPMSKMASTYAPLCSK